MQRLSKLLCVGLITALLGMLFSISVFAEEAPEPPALSLEDVTFVFEYTSDSPVSEGLVTKIYTDPISNESGIELVPEFGIGYALYDDPDTAIIDGIRINGEEVTSLRIPLTAESDVLEYKIAVKVVYAEGASGDLAQILDGTFDYSKLLSNPIILLQIVYWACLAVTGVVGIVTLGKNKSKKVKSSDEIAAKVFENSEVFKEKLLTTVTDIVKAEIVPLAQASVKSGKEAVKAILLSNSKSKDAPSALLDVFKESADIEITELVDEVRKELEEAMHSHEDARSSTLSELHTIANRANQEDVSNEKEPAKQTKSVF